MASDAIQAIKQLRREVVDAMRTLMKLAKEKQTAGMLPICEDMISKTKILLSLWDPGLVEEALNFVEEHKLVVTDDKTIDNLDTHKSLILSPFKRITQQLTSLDLKSPDLDEFATPCTPKTVEDMWNSQEESNGIEEDLLNTSDGVKSLCTSMPKTDETQFVIFPDCDDEAKEDEGKVAENDSGRMFLDTQAMCTSPSANYYKPTDEPEPWDLTQLNIEASVMCLVSKVKFLCGRCGSPAVRLRSDQRSLSKSVITSQPSSLENEKVSNLLIFYARIIEILFRSTGRKRRFIKQSILSQKSYEMETNSPMV